MEEPPKLLSKNNLESLKIESILYQVVTDAPVVKPIPMLTPEPA